MHQAMIGKVAADVVAGYQYKPEALSALKPQLEAAENAALCQPAALHSAAVIRTRLAEQAFSSGENIDTQLSALDRSIMRSLTCSPADPFLWMVLFWVRSTLNGISPDYLQYLRLSYQLGPNEGWIGLKRNARVLAIFPQLSPDLSGHALAEFANLLNSGFYYETAEIFTGAGWPERTLLLARLQNVREDYRQAFAKLLYKRGYDIDVPGVAKPSSRPWD
jgi:hypothetical protein